MKNMLESIAKLSLKEEYIFFIEIDEKQPEIYKNYFPLLKNCTENELETFYSNLRDKDEADWYRSEINKAIHKPIEELQDTKRKIISVLTNLPQKSMEYEENTIVTNKKTLKLREVMKADFATLAEAYSDQILEKDIPLLQKEILEEHELISLPRADKSVVQDVNIFDCINKRRSRRKFTDEALNIAELSYLLWATQGVISKFNDNKSTRRTVPSGGSRHPFETYLAIHNVESLKSGIYRYQPLEHGLVFLFDKENLKNKIIEASLNQPFAGNCAVTFIWSVIPYRCEWRYSTKSNKIIMQDSGHLCQNLYLASESINAGTCAIGAYDQKMFDDLLQLDGVDEFTIYVSPVGKVNKVI